MLTDDQITQRRKALSALTREELEAYAFLVTTERDGFEDLLKTNPLIGVVERAVIPFLPLSHPTRKSLEQLIQTMRGSSND